MLKSKSARRSASWLALAMPVLAWSWSCAGAPVAGLPNRPPQASGAAIDEFELVCQPDAEGCRPTRIVVEVCESETDAGCATRRGLHDFLAEWVAYDRYVARLRGEDPNAEPAP